VRYVYPTQWAILSRLAPGEASGAVATINRRSRRSGRFAMRAVAILMLTGVMTVSACATPSQRKTAENDAIQKKAAQEISRICSLPEPERDAELKKLREESGMVLYCGKP
jgi:hypothetical protein